MPERSSTGQRWIPLVLGIVAGLVAFTVSGWIAELWLTAGAVLGGGVPLYLMPWIRRRAR